VQWTQYKAFLERKKKMLVEEIENVKLRGLTAEQLRDIEENFKLFDGDKSGLVDKKELKACLYSLGEEKNKAEIDEIITKYGRVKEQDITYEVSLIFHPSSSSLLITCAGFP
jgi:Ca2+-binding EF-hand superfamily protein